LKIHRRPTAKRHHHGLRAVAQLVSVVQPFDGEFGPCSADERPEDMFRFRAGMPGDHQSRRVGFSDCDVRILLSPRLPHDVKSRTETLDEFEFAEERGEFVRRHFPADRPRPLENLPGFVPAAFAAKVAHQPMPERFRLADIHDPAERIEHRIDTRQAWRGSKRQRFELRILFVLRPPACRHGIDRREAPRAESGKAGGERKRHGHGGIGSRPFHPTDVRIIR
jgi:hypothetical protein